MKVFVAVVWVSAGVGAVKSFVFGVFVVSVLFVCVKYCISVDLIVFR